MENNKYQKLYTSAALAAAELERRLHECEAKVMLLELEKKQWEAEKVKQQMIIHQAVTTVNANNNVYLEENKRLKEEIRRLKNGDND